MLGVSYSAARSLEDTRHRASYPNPAAIAEALTTLQGKAVAFKNLPSVTAPSGAGDTNAASPSRLNLLKECAAEMDSTGPMNKALSYDDPRPEDFLEYSKLCTFIGRPDFDFSIKYGEEGKRALTEAFAPDTDWQEQEEEEDNEENENESQYHKKSRSMGYYQRMPPSSYHEYYEQGPYYSNYEQAAYSNYPRPTSGGYGWRESEVSPLSNCSGFTAFSTGLGDKRVNKNHRTPHSLIKGGETNSPNCTSTRISARVADRKMYTQGEATTAALESRKRGRLFSFDPTSDVEDNEVYSPQRTKVARSPLGFSTDMEGGSPIVPMRRVASPQKKISACRRCGAKFENKQALGWHTKNIGTEKSTCLDAAEFKYEGDHFAGSSLVEGEASGSDM